MKKIFTFVLVLFYGFDCFACTTFLLTSNSKLYFGRNYDFVSGNGMVMINSRNIKKLAYGVEKEKAINWVSKYGSITFNQFGKEFPQGGMNEKGLVVELMWLDGTKYPKADERGEISELQWIQYQLDNAATVEEVIASDSKIRIDENSAPLHFLVADNAGNVATIEFLNGAMVVHKGEKLPYSVLTNTPYADAVLQKQTTSPATSFTDNSVLRFATACKLLEEFKANDSKENPVKYSFHMLNQLAQKNFTKWSIVYDISNRRIHFTTDKNKKRRKIEMANFDFNCNKPSLALDINQDIKGTTYKSFFNLDFSKNKSLIEKSANESKQIVRISAASIGSMSDYVNTLKCQ